MLEGASRICIAETMASRELVVLRGPANRVRHQARRWLEGSEDTLWVGEPGDGRVLPRQVRSLLGQARDAVVLELFSGLDLELLAQVEGMVRGGGRLILLEPEEPTPDATLAVEPFRIEDVSVRAASRLRALMPARPTLAPIRVVRADRGTDEQARLVDRLVARWTGERSRTAVIADRGRGKSSALGLAIASLDRPVTVSGPSPDAVREVLRFGGPHARFVPLDALLDATNASHLVIDEAAQIDVPTLRRIVLAHPEAHLTWASTARGYEGTGAGWVQRFLRWLGEQGPFELLSLERPIRWSQGDALERWVREALLFDALPAHLASLVLGESTRTVRHVMRDELRDPALLTQVYGLLMHAHHRTSPGDLGRLLDAPNLALHVVFEEAPEGPRVVGVNLVAHEGALSRERSHALATQRIRGHVLPDTLVSHGGNLDAGTLRMIRSVRIATHPDRQRHGIARLLTEHVHRHYAADLFGTVFGATDELVAFRQALGYQVIRLGSAAGARSGEPSVVMVRPVSDDARALSEALRADLSRNLPLQLRLLIAESAPLAPPLERALADALPEPPPLSPTEQRARLAHYLESGQTFEAAASVLHAFACARRQDFARLEPMDATLLEARVIELASWREAAQRAGLSVAQAQRRLRIAFRALQREWAILDLNQ